MADLSGFSELHTLDNNNIELFVPRNSPGVYLLDRGRAGWVTHYAGRSDDDVAGRLKKWAAEGKYLYFKFQAFASAKAAYEMECLVYHDVKPVDNVIHPAAPAWTTYTCPQPRCTGGR